METVIGFVAGYLIGAREGKAGMNRLRESAQSIMSSPEVRRLAADAGSVAGAFTKRAPNGGS